MNDETPSGSRNRLANSPVGRARGWEADSSLPAASRATAEEVALPNRRQTVAHFHAILQQLQQAPTLGIDLYESVEASCLDQYRRTRVGNPDDRTALFEAECLMSVRLPQGLRRQLAGPASAGRRLKAHRSRPSRFPLNPSVPCHRAQLRADRCDIRSGLHSFHQESRQMCGADAGTSKAR